MKLFTSVILSVILTGVSFAQAPATAQPQEVLIRIQQDAPKAAPAVPAPVAVPVPAPVAAAVKAVAPNQFSEVGSAIGSGLNGLVESLGGATGRTVDKTGEVTGAVVDKSGKVASAVMDRTFGKDVTLVDGIDKVSKTDAGRFTMLVIAWKVMGKDALDLFRKVEGIAIGVPIGIFLIILATWITRRFWMVRSVVVKAEGPFWNKTKTYETVNTKLDDDTRYTGLFLTWLAFAILSFINVAFVIL